MQRLSAPRSTRYTILAHHQRPREKGSTECLNKPFRFLPAAHGGDSTVISVLEEHRKPKISYRDSGAVCSSSCQATTTFAEDVCAEKFADATCVPQTDTWARSNAGMILQKLQRKLPSFVRCDFWAPCCKTLSSTPEKLLDAHRLPDPGLTCR